MYITIEDLARIAPNYSEEEYISAILAAQNEIETVTQNKFEPTEVRFSFPSVKGRRISLPFPIWVIFKIEVDNLPEDTSLYSLNPYSKPPYIESFFELDEVSLEIVGIGGSFEPGPEFPKNPSDYSVFPIIRFCTTILASIKLGNPFENSLLLETSIKAEETDGHRIEYFQEANYLKNPKDFISKLLMPFKAYIGGLTL